jgi:hypothetical protein
MSGNVLTYASLKTFILNALNRQSPQLINNLDLIIMKTQRSICNAFQIEGLLKYQTGNQQNHNSILAGNPILPKPAGWLNTYSFGIFYANPFQTEANNYLRLERRNWSYCLDAWPDSTQTARPINYSDMEQDQLLLSPTPDQDYAYVWGFYQVPFLLGPTLETNFLTERTPQLLMSGCVYYANLFLQNYGEADKWKGDFDKEMQLVGTQDMKLAFDMAQHTDHTS